MRNTLADLVVLVGADTKDANDGLHRVQESFDRLYEILNRPIVITSQPDHANQQFSSRDLIDLDQGWGTPVKPDFLEGLGKGDEEENQGA